MATWDVLQALRRRWHVAVAGLVMTAALVAYVQDEPDVYYTAADVYLLPPPGASAGAGTIAMAGLVERGVNAGQDHVSVSSDVTLVDMGVYDGGRVELPNSGGQWEYSFTQPVLRVSATAPTAAESASRRDIVVDKIVQKLDEMQGDIPAQRHIWARQIPDRPLVERKVGHSTLAAGIALLLGLAGTCCCGVWADKWLGRRSALRADETMARSGPVTVR